MEPVSGRDQALEYVKNSFEQITSWMGRPVVFVPASNWNPFSSYSYTSYSPLPRISFNFFSPRPISTASTSSTSTSTSAPSTSSEKKKKKNDEVLSRIGFAVGAIALATFAALVGKQIYTSWKERNEAFKESKRIGKLLDSGALDPVFKTEARRNKFAELVNTNLKIEQIRLDRFVSTVTTLCGLAVGAGALSYGLNTDSPRGEAALRMGEVTLISSFLYGAWKIVTHSDDNRILSNLYHKVIGHDKGGLWFNPLGKGLAQEAHDAIQGSWRLPKLSSPSEQEPPLRS